MEQTDHEQEPLEELELGVWLALDIRNGFLGASSVDFNTKKIHLIEDNVDGANCVEIIKTIILQVSPTKIFTPSLFSENIHTMLRSAMVERHYDIEIVKQIDYDFQLGLNVLETLGNSSAFWLISSSLDMMITIGTVNVLFTRFERAYPDEVFFEHINFFENTSLKLRMFIDVDSLYLLQVLPPKVKIEILSSKSAKNSLYHLLNRTCTPYGGSLLKSWLIKPLYDLSAIKNRQDLIENLLNNSSLMHTIRLNLRKICHLPSCLFSIKVGKVIWSKWNSLIDFLYCVINILNEIHQVEFMVEPDLIKKLLGIDLALLTNIHLYLLHFIDISRSNLEKNLYLQSGIDPLLDDLRNNYENLDTILENANIHIDSTLVLNNRIVTVYIPQIGFLVCYDCSNFDDVPISDQNQISTWSFLFSSDTDSYFKNSTTTTLDETYGDIYQLISDREIELISTLKDVISENDNTLIATFDLITELDCICALAVVSQNSNYIKPELVNDAHTFDVVKGRHPLVETSVEFAPNDLKLNLDENLGSILVVTGANMSGKSVYLNQAALIVIMAQIGCFVPCESARIGLVDKILTRIMSRETVDKNQSTFAIDIHQLSKCLLLATSSSLLIIDEFGKGCDSFDGPALFGSTLKYLIDFEHYPRTLVSTHFHEVFANNLKILGGREVEQKLRFCYMDVKLNAKSSLLINYLHQIRDGIGFESFGNYCAKVCGVPDGIVKRAEEISTLQSKGLNFLNHSLSENEQGNYEVVEECLTCFLNVDLDVNLNDAASVGKCLESFRKCIEI